MKIDSMFYEVLLFGIPIVLILGGLLKYVQRSYSRRTEQLENRIEELQEQVIVVTGSSLPGREIMRVIGPVTGFSTVPSDAAGKFEQAEKEAMLWLIKKAHEQGANAVIDLKITIASPEPSGTGGTNPKVTYVGTAVLV